ncbi:hypothetical protein PFISCL1PPCAC_24990, partial [Pristionchus fissidentatus]
GLFLASNINEVERPMTKPKVTLFTYGADPPSLSSLAHSALVMALNPQWRARVGKESNPSTPLELVKAVLR